MYFNVRTEIGMKDKTLWTIKRIFLFSLLQ